MGTDRTMSSKEHDEDELTISRVAFSKELFLGPLDRSIKLIHWDAKPVQQNVLVNVVQHSFACYHIA
jgi:hypothetical protein